MKKWGIAVLMALSAGVIAAEGKPERAMVLWPSERFDFPWPHVFYLDRPCRLPISEARNMREYTMKDFPRPFVGCWGYALQDGMLLTISKDTGTGLVDRGTFYIQMTHKATIATGGEITRLP